MIDGTRWLAVFAPLLLLIVVWLGQAVHAHRRAIARGAKPGGEIQVAAFLPFALTALTLFWLVGGRQGSPAATVEAYMEAWMDSRPDTAAGLFAGPPTPELSSQWASTLDLIRQDLGAGRTAYGEQSGLDPARPFNSLRVTQVDESAGSAHFVVEIVRSERFATTVLGIIPTAGQRTVVLEPVVEFELREELQPGAWLPSSRWRITSVHSDVQHLVMP